MTVQRKTSFLTPLPHSIKLPGLIVVIWCYINKAEKNKLLVCILKWGMQHFNTNIKEVINIWLQHHRTGTQKHLWMFALPPPLQTTVLYPLFNLDKSQKSEKPLGIKSAAFRMASQLMLIYVLSSPSNHLTAYILDFSFIIADDYCYQSYENWTWGLMFSHPERQWHSSIK